VRPTISLFLLIHVDDHIRQEKLATTALCAKSKLCDSISPRTLFDDAHCVGKIQSFNVNAGSKHITFEVCAVVTMKKL
jgi:hypothetical protein